MCGAGGLAATSWQGVYTMLWEALMAKAERVRAMRCIWPGRLPTHEMAANGWTVLPIFSYEAGVEGCMSKILLLADVAGRTESSVARVL